MNLEVHKNGLGKRERTVTCSETTYLDAGSLIQDDCSVWGGPIITASRLMRQCRISGTPKIDNTLLDGCIGISDETALEWCNIVTSELVEDGKVLRGEVEIRDNAFLRQVQIDVPPGARVSIGQKARLRNVSIKGECYISGGEIEDCELLPGARITQGYWNRSPKVVRTPLPYFDVIEDVSSRIFIGCRSETRELWLRRGVAIGRQAGYDELEIAEYERIITNWENL